MIKTCIEVPSSTREVCFGVMAKDGEDLWSFQVLFQDGICYDSMYVTIRSNCTKDEDEVIQTLYKDRASNGNYDSMDLVFDFTDDLGNPIIVTIHLGDKVRTIYVDD